MKKLLTIPFLIVCITISFAQDNLNTGIIYGRNHAFKLTAPEGWVLDNTSGVSQGLHAVFYKSGESWEKAISVMYANTASLEDSAHQSLDLLIKFDLNTFKSNYSDLQITDGKQIVVQNNVIAKVKYLSGKSYGNYEAIAYIDAGKTGVMIILSSREKQAFENSLIAFDALVKSYFFIGEDVTIEKE